MTLLDVSIVNVAVPSIAQAVSATPSDLQWVLSGYALTFGLVLVSAGRYGDVRGRRNIFVAGLGLFTLASAAAGLANSAAWLVAVRLLQGTAAGLINPQVAGLIQQMFRPEERGRPFGLLGATIGVSTALGPLLGGALIDVTGTEDGWRWVFLVNIPVGVTAIVLGWRMVPAGPAGRVGPQRLDPIGVLLLGAGLTLLLWPLVQRGPWSLLPAGAAFLAGFVFWEHRYRRRGPPLFDLALFSHRSYALGSLIALVYFAGFTAVFFVFTLYLQDGLGYRPLAAGVATAPFALGSAAGSAMGGRLVNRLGRPLVATGLAVVAIGLAATAGAAQLAPDQKVPLATAVPLLIAGLGSGLVISPNQTLTLARVPVTQAGSAAGMLQTGQRVGSAVGIALVGTVFFGVASDPAAPGVTAFRAAILVAMGIVLVALAAALVDSIGGTANGRTELGR